MTRERELLTTVGDKNNNNKNKFHDLINGWK